MVEKSEKLFLKNALNELKRTHNVFWLYLTLKKNVFAKIAWRLVETFIHCASSHPESLKPEITKKLLHVSFCLRCSIISSTG